MEGRAGRADQALDFLLGEDLWQAMALFRIRSVVDTPSPPECLAVKRTQGSQTDGDALPETASVCEIASLRIREYAAGPGDLVDS